MEKSASQGEIIKVENIKYPLLVVSKDFFNTSGEVVVCPIVENTLEGPLHIYIETDKIKGYARCEDLKNLDLKARRFKKIDSISIFHLMDIVYAIQSIFDYF